MMQKNLSQTGLILIITTTVYSFSSMATAFYMMGIKALPWFFISAFCYFIPYALIVAQYTKKYAHRAGTIYDWLQESLSPKAAFITAFLWYCSYFTWMVSLFMKLLIPMSILLFGQDLTGDIHWFGWSPQIWLALLSILLVLSLTWLISRGFQTILSFLKLSGAAMIGLLLISLISNLFLISQAPSAFLPNLVKSWQAKSFFAGTGHHFWTQLPFFIFAITAFGGLDTVASLADRTPDSRRRFPKGVIWSACLIVLLYFGGILLWSGGNDLTVLRQTDQAHLGNLMYGLMGSLADNTATALGGTPQVHHLLQQFYLRYTAFTLLIAYLGLLSSISYGPLKSLLQGTPKDLWPAGLVTMNRQKMPYKALWLQAGGISATILALSLRSTFVNTLFNQLTYMTNVARAVPYLVVAFSYFYFIKKQIVSADERLLVGDRKNYGLAASVCICITLAILFQLYEPLLQGNYFNTLSLIIGPTLFGLCARLIYRRFEKRTLVTMRPSK